MDRIVKPVPVIVLLKCQFQQGMSADHQHFSPVADGRKIRPGPSYVSTERLFRRSRTAQTVVQGKPYPGLGYRCHRNLWFCACLRMVERSKQPAGGFRKIGFFGQVHLTRNGPKADMILISLCHLRVKPDGLRRRIMRCQLSGGLDPAAGGNDRRLPGDIRQLVRRHWPRSQDPVIAAIDRDYRIKGAAGPRLLAT